MKKLVKKATVQYRELKCEGPLALADLKAMLVDVLRRRGDHHAIGENAKLRVLDLDLDGSIVVLNKVSPPPTWDKPVFCGQLLHLQAGSDVQAVMQSLEEDTDEFLLQNISVGGDARVVKGVLYFAVNRNHVGLIEGQTAKGGLLERYLSALFQRAGELDPGETVKLNALFSTEDGKAVSEFSELTLRANATVPVRAGKEVTVETEREAGEARREGASISEILKLMGWSDEAVHQLEGEVPDGGRIEGFLKVFIKSKRKKVLIPRETINEALRNSEFGLQGDGRERNGLVRLSVTKDVASIGSLLDPEDAMLKIVEALREWAAAGKIDCRFDV